MTNGQNPLFTALKTTIENEISVGSNCAAHRYMDGLEFEEVRGWFEAIATEKGLRDAKIVVTDESFSRGTLDVLMTWAEIE